MSGSLEGKTIVVTGAAGGLGGAAARLFAEAGARLVLGDLNAAGLRDLERELDDAVVKAVAGDLSRERDARTLIAAAPERLDGLFNVVGISGRSLGDGPAHACELAGWERVLAVNLTSAFLCCKHAVPRMQEGGGGSIVNLGSVLGLGGHPLFATHAYAASKGGLIVLTRAMAATYARDGIRCNVLCPGLVRTPMSSRAQTNSEIQAALPDLQPLTGDLLSPKAIAEAALFLLSEASAALTGVVLPVDAGWTLR